MSDPHLSVAPPDRAPAGDDPSRARLDSWQAPRKQERQGLRVARILALIGALGIAAIGLLGGGTGLVVALLNPAENRLSMVVASASLIALAVGLGLSLAWQAGQAIAGRPSSRFEPRQIWLWILIFVVALILGQLVLSTDVAALIAFPFFHIAAAILPPLIIVALMGRAVRGATRWRDVILELGSGAFLSTSLAFTLEFVAIVGVAVAGLAIVAMLPGGIDVLQTLANRLQDPASLQDPAHLASSLLSPLVAIAILLFTAGVIPLIEESVKTIGVGLLAYRRPSMAEAVVWGLAGGAGFAVAEALFNTIGGLEGWAGVALLRVGASLLHCFTGGLMGLGWYYLLAERRWARTFALYAAAVALHGLWNALAAGMSLVSFFATEEGSTAARLGLAGLGSLAVLLLLLLVALGQVVGLVLLARHVARHGVPSPPLPGPPAAFQTPDSAGADTANEQL